VAHLVGKVPPELSGNGGILIVPSVSYLDHERGASVPGEGPRGAESLSASYTWGGAGNIHWDAAPSLTDPKSGVKYRVATHSDLDQASDEPELVKGPSSQ